MAFGRLFSLMGKFPSPEDFVPVRQDTRDEWFPKIQVINGFLAKLIVAYENAGISE